MIFDLGAYGDALQVFGQDVEHRSSGYECCRSKWNREFIACPIVISADLCLPFGDGDAVQCSHLWRRQVIQGCIDMPAVEAREALLRVFRRDYGLVESDMTGVFELRLEETFVIVHHSITDELDLGLAGDGLKVGM